MVFEKNHLGVGLALGDQTGIDLGGLVGLEYEAEDLFACPERHRFQDGGRGQVQVQPAIN
jgi:hypothetical protein